MIPIAVFAITEIITKEDLKKWADVFRLVAALPWPCKHRLAKT
ncbi:MAG: hypothetical protein ACLS9G_00055 [Akkermansia sp.]